MAKNYRSQLTGCFGDPIDENPTGVMEEAAYHACGLDYRYITMKVKAEDLKAGIAGIRAMNFRGLNLTILHKVAVIPYLDELSEQARIIGAVNVIINENGKLIGDNTDGRGFLKSLTDIGFDPKGKTVTFWRRRSGESCGGGAGAGRGKENQYHQPFRKTRQGSGGTDR